MVATSYIILHFVEILGFRFCMSAKVLTSSLVEMVLIVVPMKWQNWWKRRIGTAQPLGVAFTSATFAVQYSMPEYVRDCAKTKKWNSGDLLFCLDFQYLNNCASMLQWWWCCVSSRGCHIWPPQVVGIPKTIDNDIPMLDCTFGHSLSQWSFQSPDSTKLTFSIDFVSFHQFFSHRNSWLRSFSANNFQGLKNLRLRHRLYGGGTSH